MATNAEALALAVQYHLAGNLAQAEPIYRQILQTNPADARALHLLGVLAHQVGQHQAALDLLRQAVAILPHVGECHASLAAVYVALGRWDEAETSCRQALRCQPNSPEAHYSLGNVFNQRGRPQEAVASFREAVRLRPGYAEAHNNLGLALAAQGQVEEAMTCYREVLRLRPDLPEPHYNLGSAFQKQGRSAEAVACFEQALRLRPNFAEAHHNLGLALAEQGRLEEAVGSYREVLRLRPDLPEPHNNLGNALQTQGRPAEAIACFERALRLRPDYAEAHHNLGLALAEQGRLEEAVNSYQEALRLQPDLPDAHINLGNALKQMGNVQEAVTSLREELRWRPGYAEAHNNLGLALAEQGQIEEAMACYREALRLRPDLHEAHCNLGVALGKQGRPDEALACYQQAVRIKPDDAVVLNNLGNAYKDQSRQDEAIACYRKAVAADPKLQFIQSNLLFALHYHAAYEPKATFAEHLRWAEQFGTAAAPRCPLQPVQRDPDRRLRLGYVSADFCEHVMGRYSEAVVGAHDRAKFEVFCYANVSPPDALTQRIRASADHWRSVVGLSDDRVAEMIRQDQIDLLIDLAGHTGGNRLGVFAKKPAPIQVTHCGYPASTGLTAIDYRLTDPFCDPPGQTEHLHSERLVRLPKGHWCFKPPSGPEVGPLPARGPGQVTFGSFNNLAKVTEEMIGLWSQILKDLPESRMVLKTGTGSPADERVLAAFVRHGVGKERVTLLGRQRDYFGLYQGVDICLDTYPYTGCNVTGDALWMGVPVVSLAGPSCVTRLGVAALVQVGLEDLVTETPAAYVEAAVRLAQDLPRLRELRAQLRERLERSVGDVRRFTRDLEAAYRGMWEQFCREDA